mmetsp:Transcript_36188/g.71156  ORF Transcript_36188/g.71156 Transcript_36188/m.71156 type:complete len:235 (+) Transcript_36188:317-1021(+)
MRKLSKKKPSAAALYDVVGLDLFFSSTKLSHIAQHIATKLPAAEDRLINGVPTTLIINLQMPSYSPKMVGKSTKEEGYTIVVIMRMTDQAKKEVQNGTTPAAKLLCRFADHANPKYPLHNRLKCIGVCRNLQDLKFGMGLSGTVKQFNGKPFFTGPKCHTFFQGDGYLEIDVDFHRYCWAFKKAAHKVLDYTKSMVIDLAFVVEGQTDDELPEQILGCARLNLLDGKTHSLPVG